jgi:hypothetical protein
MIRLSAGFGRTALNEIGMLQDSRGRLDVHGHGEELPAGVPQQRQSILPCWIVDNVFVPNVEATNQ